MTQTNLDGEVPKHDARCRDECVSMLTNQESDWNIDALTDTEIYAAIHYLEPDQETRPSRIRTIRIKILAS